MLISSIKKEEDHKTISGFEVTYHFKNLPSECFNELDDIFLIKFLEAFDFSLNGYSIRLALFAFSEFLDGN